LDALTIVLFLLVAVAILVEVTNRLAVRERLEHEEIPRGVIAAQRVAVINLRDRGQINDKVLRTIERELDLEELRMEG
jgi:hypothetical protein